MATVTLGSKAVDSIVKLNENGVAQEYIVVHQGLPGAMYDASCNGTWLLRRNIFSKRVWDADSNRNYKDSDIHAWLNSTMLSKYDADIRNAIKQVKIPYFSLDPEDYGLRDGANGLSCKLFLLSSYEVGLSQSDISIYVPVEGTKLDYFEWGKTASSNNKRIAQFNGTASGWWLRSPLTHHNSFDVLGIKAAGTESSGWYPTAAQGIRPLMVLPQTLFVDEDNQVTTNLPPTISGSDTALGSFANTPPSAYSYTVTDPNGDAVTVTEAIDGKALRTYTPTLGQANSLQLTTDQWLEVLNGSHTLTITASDGKAAAVRTLTFTKNVTRIQFCLNPALDAAEMPTKALESLVYSLPAGATLKVEVCNNGFDASPTWEDVTQRVLAGDKIFLANAVKTAAQWGYGIRVTIDRGTAVGACWCAGGSGFFE